VHRSILAAGHVEPIPADWQFPGLTPIPIRRAKASSSLSDQYAPERICDGDRRRTKWVSPVRPTATAPQWVTLSLAGGARTVTAVAVFGEGAPGYVPTDQCWRDGYEDDYCWVPPMTETAILRAVREAFGRR